MVAAGRGDRAGAGRVQRQSRVLLQPERTGRKGDRPRPPHPDRRAGRGRRSLATAGRRAAGRISASPTARPTSRVVYNGVLPDLFREGQGVVAEGRLRAGRRVRRHQRARQARREIHAARSRRRAEKSRALAGRRHTGSRAGCRRDPLSAPPTRTPRKSPQSHGILRPSRHLERTDEAPMDCLSGRGKFAVRVRRLPCSPRREFAAKLLPKIEKIDRPGARRSKFPVGREFSSVSRAAS